MKNRRDFFAYARERYQILQRRRAGQPRPWTDDPILQSYRFCNVFREDDTVTQWIRRHVTHDRHGPLLLGAMVIARWFNRIETLERLLPPPGLDTVVDGPSWFNDLLFSWELDGWAEDMRERLEGVQPLVTGAYMVKTPANMSKLEGILWCLEQFLPEARQLQRELEQGATRLCEATERLQRYPYLGPFMAYEVVTDLRHTPILGDAPDIMLWANPGPGAARGMARVVGAPLDTYNRHRPEDVHLMNTLMRRLLVASQDRGNWPSEWPQWEMRDVEHTLCEFDKYERARLGEGRPKQLYDGAKERADGLDQAD